jgi:hypothetical protein
MYISFTSTKPYQIKLFTGETNFVTGQSLNPSQEIWYHHIERLETRRKWQKMDQSLKYQDYIVCPLQSQVSGYVDPLGALCRFEPQRYDSEQLKEIKKHLDEDMEAHALRIEVTPYVTKMEVPSNLSERSCEKLVSVKIKTPGGTLLLPSTRANDSCSYIQSLLEDGLGRYCMGDASLWVGNEVVKSEPFPMAS